MSHTIQTFPARLADLEFRLAIPEGFIQPEMSSDNVDFSDPSVSAPLAIVSSPVALALITVAARPAYENGSVEDWVRYLCSHFGLEITGLVSGFCGMVDLHGHIHPCVFVEAKQTQDGTDLTMRIVALEDGGRFVTAHAMCASELWPSFGSVLEHAVTSFCLTRPRHPTVSCVPNGPVPICDMPGVDIGEWPRGRGAHVFDEVKAKRELDDASATARTLIKNGQFDDAELLITNLRSTVHFTVTLSRLYRERLTELSPAAQSNAALRPAAEAVFERALKWSMMAYPDPHTAIEAENFERGRQADRAALIDLLGYEPACA